MLDLTAECSEPTALLRLPYLNVPTLDMTTPVAAQLQEACAFIQAHASAGGTVFVH